MEICDQASLVYLSAPSQVYQWIGVLPGIAWGTRALNDPPPVVLCRVEEESCTGEVEAWTVDPPVRI